MFGISIFGVVLTVAVFMAGLGAGSLLGSRRVYRFAPACALRLLAWLEAGIALYALLLPFLMPWLDAGLIHIGSGLSLPYWQGLQGAAVFLLLFPAALAMGFAFPLALRAAQALQLSLGAMYGINAIGGGLGAVLPLFLLPVLGWRMALFMVAALGLALAALAWRLALRMPDVAGKSTAAQTVRRPPGADLLAYAGVGAAALILEVVWSRMYGMVLLRTEYVLAVLLLVYLLGIGLGSVLARRVRTSARLNLCLNLLPVVAALLAIVAQYALPSLSLWASGTRFDSLLQGIMLQGGAVLLLTLPVTLALGAWLPLLARRFALPPVGQGDEPAGGISDGGWWYGMNSLGASVGALLAGFVLLPLMGSTMTLGFGAMLLLLCGMRWVGDRRYWLALPVFILLFWPVRDFPAVSGLLPELADVSGLSLYEDAVAMTHVVERPSGQRLLLSDLQRMDASSDPTAVTVQKNQARLPLLLHPDPHTVLFLGLGTGVTASGSEGFGLLQRTAVELSLGAIEAARSYFKPVNGGVGEKIYVLHDDARRFLRTDEAHYDVIIGDLFHPDMVGRANLLSLQQFKRGRERLADGGIFVQWLALNQFDVTSLKVVLRTFRSAFSSGGDEALLFSDGYRVALVGLRQSTIDSERLLARWQGMSPSDADTASGGEGLWTWLGRYWGKIPEFADVPVQDEWAPVIEFSLPRVRYSGGVNPAATWRWMLSWHEDAELAAARLHVRAAHFERFKRAWAASGLDVRLWLAELAGDEAQAVQWARLAHRANADDRWPAFALADRMFAGIEAAAASGRDRRDMLQRILDLRPDHEQALRALLQLAEKNGDADQARQWRQRLAVVSPLAFDVRKR
ncbi:MAG: spermine synthase [Mariprofundaceae bacterium]|nr:spermine synthase [Mariprofundaceae bacterium]